MTFNEDTRVKIPTIIHLTCLGYDYLSLKDAVWDEDTNIFTDVFKQSIAKINSQVDSREIEQLLKEVKLTLDNEDLGEAFYQLLIKKSGIKLIDFTNLNSNTFNVVTELSYKNKDE